MESESFPSSEWWVESIHTTVCFIFFSFTALFSLFSFLLYLLRLLQPCACICETCKSFLSASWSAEFNNLCDWYTHLLHNSPTRTINVHVLGCTITANPDNVEHMLKTRFDNYPKGKQFSAILGDLLGKGIFNVDGHEWEFQRKMASLELGSVSVRSYAFEIVRSEIHSRLLPLFRSVSTTEASTMDLQDVLRRFSFDTICRFSFGIDPVCLTLSMPVSNFAVAFDTASRLSAERAMTASPLVWKLKRLLNIGSERKLRDAIRSINVLAEEVIRQRRRSITTKSSPTHNDLLSRFMSSVDDDRYLRDIVISFLLAGRDTVAAALTGFFWLLSRNPNVEQSILEEAAVVMDPAQEIPSFEQLRRMQYLHAAVHESMRLFPPVQFDSKFALEDDVLPDESFISRGTRVTYHPYAMGRMESIWGPDCLEFRPERWLHGGVFCSESAYKYPVFQGGSRVCLGKEMSMVEMKTVAISLMRKFDIQVVDRTSKGPRFAAGLTATMMGGLEVSISSRPLQDRV